METVAAAAQDLESPVAEYHVSWIECIAAAGKLWDRIKANPPMYIYGVPRGGVNAALLVQMVAGAQGHGRWMLKEHLVPGAMIIDDLVDSGETFKRYTTFKDALFRKPHSPKDLAPDAVEINAGWIVFPWERDDQANSSADDIVIRLLQYIGEDPTRDGLRETPKRVLKSWKEMTAGYQLDPQEILSKAFDQPHDELVLLEGIEFHSTCEHHLLPFYGTAAVGYIPQKNVVGISKLARVVDLFARRLQIQERLTSQIASAIWKALEPRGVGVVIKAKHSCMGCRGVMKPDANMTTSVMLGLLREDQSARSEFLSLVKL